MSQEKEASVFYKRQGFEFQPEESGAGVGKKEAVPRIEQASLYKPLNGVFSNALVMWAEQKNSCRFTEPALHCATFKGRYSPELLKEFLIDPKKAVYDGPKELLVGILADNDVGTSPATAIVFGQILNVLNIYAVTSTRLESGLVRNVSHTRINGKEEPTEILEDGSGGLNVYNQIVSMYSNKNVHQKDFSTIDCISCRIRKVCSAGG